MPRPTAKGNFPKGGIMPEYVLCPNGHQMLADDTVCPNCSAATEHEGVPLPSEPIRPNIPGYEILGELGRGGMGIVYKARHLTLKRTVALKMLRDGDFAGPEELARFRSEAEAVARLHHPNIVQIYEIGEHRGKPYFSLEYVEGGNLAVLAAGRPLPAPQSAHLVETVARAVHAAHARGIIHRDLKPANILLQIADLRLQNEDLQSPDVLSPESKILNLQPAIPKITDFGLAKKLEGSTFHTQTGAIMGTPSYMAPEQAQGKSTGIGPAADIYALGAVLYQLTTGRPPFLGETPIDTLHQVVTVQPVPPSRLQPKVPRDLEIICLKCLEKDPARRYVTAEALADDLRSFQEGRPIKARAVGKLEQGWRWCRRNPVVAGLTVTLFVALAAGLALVTWKWLEADYEKNLKEIARQETAARAGEAADRADALDNTLYFNRIGLAYREWLDNNVDPARQLLEDCPTKKRGWEWHFLDRLFHQEEWTLTHPGKVRAVAFHPDGKRLATAAADNMIRIWDLNTGQMVAAWEGHEGPVNSLCFHPRGARLVSGSADKTVRQWETATGTSRVLLRHEEAVNQVLFNPAGTRIASASADKTVKITNAPQAGDIATLSYQSSRGLMPWRGRRTAGRSAVASKNKTTSKTRVEIWDVDASKIVDKVEDERTIGSLVFGGKGEWLFLTGQTRRDVKGIKLETKKEILFGHGSPVTALAMQPGGRLMASAGWDGTVKLWDTAVADREPAIFRGHTHQLTCVAISPDGRHLATGSWDNTIKIWNLGGGREYRLLDNRLVDVASVVFDPKGQWLATGGWHVRIIEKSTIGTKGITEGEICVWDMAQAGQAKPRLLHGHTGGRVSHLAVSPDGRWLASADDGKKATILIWDVEQGTVLHTLDGHQGPIHRVAFLPDGRLASAGKDRAVHLWDVSTEKIQQTFQDHGGPVRGLAVSPDGKLLASGCADGLVRVWSLDTGTLLHTGKGHTDQVVTLAFSPDGRLLASGGEDKKILVWETDSGKTRHTLLGHSGPVYALAFHPTAPRLASGGGARLHSAELKFWDTQTGQEALTLRGHQGALTALAFDPLGQRLASTDAGSDKESAIRIWDATPRQNELSVAQP